MLVLDKQKKNIYAATDGDPMVLRIPIKKDGSADDPIVISRGHSPFDGIELDDEGNIYLSEIMRNEIMVLSPDGRQRVMIATQDNAPLDNNASLVLRNGVLYAAKLMVGNSGRPLHSAAALAPFPPHAESARIGMRPSAAHRMGLMRRVMRGAPFDRTGV